MATETNTYSVDMATGLLENYLVGKTAIEITHEGLSLILSGAKIVDVGKNYPGTEAWITLDTLGTVFFEQAKIVTVS